MMALFFLKYSFIALYAFFLNGNYYFKDLKINQILRLNLIFSLTIFQIMF